MAVTGGEKTASAVPGAALAPAPAMRPAQIEALSGTALLVFSALKRGPIGILAFLGATALIAHATKQRIAQGFR